MKIVFPTIYSAGNRIRHHVHYRGRRDVRIILGRVVVLYLRRVLVIGVVVLELRVVLLYLGMVHFGVKLTRT